MASSSPGPGPAAQPAAHRQAEIPYLQKEDWEFLEEQVEVGDWTRPQPEEEKEASLVRCARVKEKMVEAIESFEAIMAKLSVLRTARDRASASKRMGFRLEIELLRDSSKATWDLLAQLVNQGTGYRKFCTEIHGRLYAANRSGSQEVRRSQEAARRASQEAPAAGVPAAVAEVPAALVPATEVPATEVPAVELPVRDPVPGFAVPADPVLEVWVWAAASAPPARPSQPPQPQAAGKMAGVAAGIGAGKVGAAPGGPQRGKPPVKTLVVKVAKLTVSTPPGTAGAAGKGKSGPDGAAVGGPPAGGVKYIKVVKPLRADKGMSGAGKTKAVGPAPRSGVSPQKSGGELSGVQKSQLTPSSSPPAGQGDGGSWGECEMGPPQMGPQPWGSSDGWRGRSQRKRRWWRRMWGCPWWSLVWRRRLMGKRLQGRQKGVPQGM